jgi:outer membrane protein OmpA-like peptidoglycan-associated protein
LQPRRGGSGEDTFEHENEQGEKQERQQSQRQQENGKKSCQFQNNKYELERQEQATAHGIYLLAVYITQRPNYSFTLARGTIPCELFHCPLRNVVRKLEM